MKKSFSFFAAGKWHSWKFSRDAELRAIKAKAQKMGANGYFLWYDGVKSDFYRFGEPPAKIVEDHYTISYKRNGNWVNLKITSGDIRERFAYWHSTGEFFILRKWNGTNILNVKKYNGGRN